MTTQRKIRLGLFLYTPMIGGAEQYLKDLLFNIDRDHFEVTLFCEPWQEFIDFLDLPHCPPHQICYIKMREVGGHYGAKELTDTTASKQLPWWEKKLLDVISAQKRIGLPIFKIPGRIGRACMQYGFLALNNIRLRAAFRKNPIDVLHVLNGGYPGAQSAQIAGWLAKRAGCRVALMSVCNTPAAYHFPKTYEKFLDHLVKRYFDALIVPGDYIGKLLVDLRGFAPPQLKKIPEGVASPEQYGATLSIKSIPSPSIGEGQGEGETQQIKSSAIVMVAGFLPHKGHRVLLEALEQLRPEFPDLYATLIGDGPILADMRKLAAQLGVSNLITFAGFRPLSETLTTMASADIFVHPALMDGMPYVILHAMSLAKPVVATPVGGIPEAVIHEKTGLLVQPGDIGALAQSIRALLHNPEQIRAMGAAGRAHYEENYTVEAMVKRHAALYQNLFTSPAVRPKQKSSLQ